MKVGRVFLLLALLNPTGCAFLYYGAQSLYSEPYNALQECAFRERMRRLAQDAWRQICAAGGKTYSATYAKGFEDGFVDFVDADGTGDPPAVAPEHLRRELRRSPAGQTAIEDWYAGFRHGALVAKSSGLREQYIMPIALPPNPPQDPMPAQVIVTTPAAEPAKTSQRQMKPSAPAQEIKPVAAREIKPVAPARVGPVMPEPLMNMNVAPVSGYVTWERSGPIGTANNETVRRVGDVE